MRHRLLMLIAAVVLAACSKRPEPFVPVERAGALSPQGQRASVYDVIMDGQMVGEATVWSDGARREELPERGTRTVVHVGLLVESHDRALRMAFDEVALDRVILDDAILDDVLPSIQIGDARIPPHSVARFDFYFEMPPKVMPQAVDAFDARWLVTDDSGEGRYTQHTPFIDNPWLRFAGWERVYYTPFYDPFIGPAHYDPPPRVIVDIPPPPTARPRARR